MRKLLIIIISLLVLTGCSLPGLGGSVKKNSIVIGSGNTSERQILSSILALLIQEEMPDVDVDIVNNLGSSVLIFQALKNNNINLSSSMYTGTSLLGELDMEPILDPVETFETVVREYHKRYDATWFPSYGFENTYSFMVKKEFAEKYNLKTISDLEAISGEIKVGIDSGWLDRPLDGYDQFKVNYGFEFSEVFPMEIGLVYSALDSKQLEVALGYSTDGRIDAFDLVVLEDDLNHFPSYSASPVVSNDLLATYPQLESILLKLENTISVQTMQALNRQSDEMAIEPHTVAKEFLESHNYFRDSETRSLKDIPLYSELDGGRS